MNFLRVHSRVDRLHSTTTNACLLRFGILELSRVQAGDAAGQQTDGASRKWCQFVANETNKLPTHFRLHLRLFRCCADSNCSAAVPEVPERKAITGERPDEVNQDGNVKPLLAVATVVMVENRRDFQTCWEIFVPCTPL